MPNNGEKCQQLDHDPPKSASQTIDFANLKSPILDDFGGPKWGHPQLGTCENRK